MTTPNPYGTDFWLGGTPLDFDPSFRLATGRQLLAQSLVSRLTTGRGTAIDCPNDCLDIRDLVSDGLTISQLNSISGLVQGEVLKDQRVKTVLVTTTFSLVSSVLNMTIAVTSLYGPFSLTLAVSQVTVQILNANLPTAQ